MSRKIIIKNKTKDLVDTTILCATNEFLNKGIVDIFGETIISFGYYECVIKKLKSGTITVVFKDKEC